MSVNLPPPGPPCGECGAPTRLLWGMLGRYYRCTKFPACRGTHGAHQADGRPLGVPAPHATKQARIRAHDVFDKLWKSKRMSRSEAYRWMQAKMKMTKDEAHIGRLTEAECEKLIHLATEALRVIPKPKSASDEGDGDDPQVHRVG